jgi:hypothetical protein
MWRVSREYANTAYSQRCAEKTDREIIARVKTPVRGPDKLAEQSAPEMVTL